MLQPDRTLRPQHTDRARPPLTDTPPPPGDDRPTPHPTPPQPENPQPQHTDRARPPLADAPPPPGRAPAPEPLHDAAALVVHGIGNFHPGSGLRHMAEPVAAQIGVLARRHGWSVTRRPGIGAVTPVVITLRRAGERRTVMLEECIWSGSFERLSLGRSVLWALCRLPALLILLLPDDEDWRTIRSELSGAATPASLLAVLAGPDRPLLAVTGKLLFRATLFVGIPAVVWRALGWLIEQSRALPAPLVAVLAACACLGVVIAAATHARWNTFAHVPAAIAPDRRRAMVAAVRQSIDRISALTARPTVVAHSQGGYLTHAALDGEADPATGQPTNPTTAQPPAAPTGASPRWRFIGVGSGLRPLTFLSRIDRPRYLAVLWAVAGCFACIIAALHNRGTAVLDAVVQLLGAVGLVGLTGRIGPWPAALPRLPAAGSRAPEPVIEASAGVLLMLLAGAVVFAAIAVAYLRGNDLFTPLSTPRRVSTWIEASTRHDLVGRLPLVPLPADAVQEELSGSSNPILDHTEYFSSSVLPLRVAIELLDDAGVLPDQAEADACLRLSERLRALARRRWQAATTLICACGLVPVLATWDRATSSTSVILGFTTAAVVVSVPVRWAQTLLGRRMGYAALGSQDHADASQNHADATVALWDRLCCTRGRDRFVGWLAGLVGGGILAAALVSWHASLATGLTAGLAIAGGCTAAGGAGLAMSYQPRGAVMVPALLAAAGLILVAPTPTGWSAPLPAGLAAWVAAALACAAVGLTGLTIRRRARLKS